MKRFVAYTTVIIIAPLLYFLRILIRLVNPSSSCSVWTGRPILTLPLKARAERMFEKNVYTIVRDKYYITDDFDIVLSDLRVASYPPIQALLPYVAFCAMLIFCKRVHAFADSGILQPSKLGAFNRLELAFYFLFGIDLFIWTYGADVRTNDQTLSLGKPNACTHCPSIGRFCVCESQSQKSNISRLSSIARSINTIGDLSEYVPCAKKDLYYWPVENKSEFKETSAETRLHYSDQTILRIAHAPNHRYFKGTNYLIDAVERINRSSRSVQLDLIEGVSNAHAIKMYRSAHIIVDQLLIGFHGYIALEAMSLSRPVMCFIRKPEEYLLNHQDCPIINTNVAELESSLRYYSMNIHLLYPLAIKSREYVDSNYSVSSFSARLRAHLRSF